MKFMSSIFFINLFFACFVLFSLITSHRLCLFHSILSLLFCKKNKDRLFSFNMTRQYDLSYPMIWSTLLPMDDYLSRFLWTSTLSHVESMINGKGQFIKRESSLPRFSLVRAFDEVHTNTIFFFDGNIFIQSVLFLRNRASKVAQVTTGWFGGTIDGIILRNQQFLHSRKKIGFIWSIAIESVSSCLEW